MPIEAVIAVCAEAFIGAVISTAVEGVYNKLKGDPARIAYQRALTKAIQQYALGDRLLLAQALTKDGSVLSEKDVTDELAQILKFDRRPNAELIGKRWRDALDTPPSVWRDFTKEADFFINLLTNALRETDVYRPVFELQRLDAIAQSSVITAESLKQIQHELASLLALVDTRFGDQLAKISRAVPDIREQVRDFSRLIDDKTRDFVGRKFVFDAVNTFMAENARGYFFIRGEPGIGKTSLIAQMVRNNGYIHHFNIRAEGINKAGDFLRNVCAQLIAVYDLEHRFLPPETGQDAGFFNKILGEIASKLGGSKCIIVVDALDEVDGGTTPFGANLLYLPVILPEGVYIVATLRKIPLALRIDCEQTTLDLEQDSVGNLADIREYVEGAVLRPAIAEYIHLQQIEASYFVETMVTKSEGNFIYLRYVLNDIEGGKYRHSVLNQLPQGLLQYYEKHWEYMKGQDKDGWFAYKLPVLVGLAAMPQEISIDLISDFSRIRDKQRIYAVLQEWSQFLDEVKLLEKVTIVTKYKLYHASFFDFIASRPEVKLKAMEQQVGDDLFSSAFGDIPDN